MHRRLVQIAGLAALLSLSQMATATTVTLSSSIAGGTLLSAVHTGVFDGTSVLPSSYIVNGAYYEFVFGDEKDPLTISQRTVSTEVGSYVFVSRSPAPPCPSYATSCSSLENEVHVRDVTEHIVVDRIGQRESVEVSLAGKVVGSGATTMFQTTAVGDPISAGSSLDFYYVVHPYTDLIGRYHPGVEYDYFSDNYTQTTTITQDWTKEFVVSGNISDQSILDQLSNTDQLNFSLLVSGDLDLIKGRLILDIADGGSVPEPSSMLLTLLGLASLHRCRQIGVRPR